MSRLIDKVIITLYQFTPSMLAIYQLDDILTDHRERDTGQVPDEKYARLYLNLLTEEQYQLVSECADLLKTLDRKIDAFYQTTRD